MNRGPTIQLSEPLSSCESVTAFYLSGQKKQRLVEWWLKLVEDRCNKYLEKVQYDFEAVPYDYLDTPPKNPAQVSNNLQIITSLIHPSNGTVQRELVEPLRWQIYEKIDEFLRVSHRILQISENHSENHHSLKEDIKYVNSAQRKQQIS